MTPFRIAGTNATTKEPMSIDVIATDATDAMEQAEDACPEMSMAICTQMDDGVFEYVLHHPGTDTYLGKGRDLVQLTSAARFKYREMREMSFASDLCPMLLVDAITRNMRQHEHA